MLILNIIMILVFDTYSGLCNQFLDINCAINFCLINNFQFTFRFASHRTPKLDGCYDVDFDKLFDISFLNKYPLYVDYKSCDVRPDNTLNYHNKYAYCILNQMFPYEMQLRIFFHEYVILRQFWVTYKLGPFYKAITNVYFDLKPATKIMDKFNEIKSIINPSNEKYNLLHFRHEQDFVDYFHIIVPSLDNLIKNIPYKNKSNKLYVASTGIRDLIKDDSVYDLIFFKDESLLNDYNFEEKGFIDFMFGLESEEIYGHSKSSFSMILNERFNTNNYYDKL